MVSRERKIEVRNAILREMEWLNGYVHDILDGFEDMSDESCMEIKQDIMTNWVQRFPMQAPHCIFCADTDSNCTICVYKDTHGVCAKEYSTWKKLLRAVRRVKLAIDEYHLEGDTYGESPSTLPTTDVSTVWKEDWHYN